MGEEQLGWWLPLDKPATAGLYAGSAQSFGQVGDEVDKVIELAP